MLGTVDAFLSQCSSCGQCRTVCPFLDRHGTPDEIVKHRPQVSFLCTNCTACDKRCPLDLSPSKAIFETKHLLVTQDRVPPRAADALRRATDFVERGHSPPFIRYDRTRVAFWPGCSLAGTSPETTRKTADLLSQRLGETVGLALDCCFDPLFQMGDTDPVEEASRRIRGRLSDSGIERLYVGCVNCRKVFACYLPDLPILHVLEALPSDLLKTAPSGDLYLHHPCPLYRVPGMTGRVKDVLGHVQEEVDEQSLPACCGLGGSLNVQDPQLADLFAERVTMAAYGADLVTSCMGCKNVFLKRGKTAYHILELVTGAKVKRRAVPSLKKWANRLLLSRAGLR